MGLCFPISAMAIREARRPRERESEPTSIRCQVRAYASLVWGRRKENRLALGLRVIIGKRRGINTGPIVCDILIESK